MGSKVKNCIHGNIAAVIMTTFALLCAGFLFFGQKAEDGSITLDGSNAVISASTEKFIEDAEAAMNRLMNVDAATDAQTIAENSENAMGQGFYVTIEDILARRLAPGSTAYQCSRYTGYLATGKSVYSTANIDYGPVHGKDIAAWLVKNYGFKYIDQPVMGAIGSGGFNTAYGHTALYLYSTGANTAMVDDANYTPLTVVTHNMNISGWVWVVPGNYETTQETAQTTQEKTAQEKVDSDNNVGIKNCQTHTVVQGDTMGGIMATCEGKVEYGEAMDAYAKTWYSTKAVPGQSVYDGWHSATGIGLYVGDVIERRR